MQKAVRNCLVVTAFSRSESDCPVLTIWVRKVATTIFSACRQGWVACLEQRFGETCPLTPSLGGVKAPCVSLHPTGAHTVPVSFGTRRDRRCSFAQKSALLSRTVCGSTSAAQHRETCGKPSAGETVCKLRLYQVGYRCAS